MKSSILKLTAFLLIVASISVSCQPDEPNYPIEISLTELETQCQWTNLAYDDKVIMINSNEELEKYISCTGNSYPAIDFSKQTLLLVSGKTDYGICEFDSKRLQQLSSDKYKLHIEINLSDAIDIKEWAMAFIVNKMNEKDEIELNVTRNVFYSIEVSFTELELEAQCQWINLKYHTSNWSWRDTEVIIINNNEELENYISCSNENYPEIDFSRHTLLLANGIAPYCIHPLFKINKHLLQLSMDKYKLDIEITVTSDPMLERWVMAFIVNKMSEEVKVELNVAYIKLY